MTRISRRSLIAGATLTGMAGILPNAAGASQLDNLPRSPRFAGAMRGAAISRQSASATDPLIQLDTLLADEPGVYGLMVVDQRGNLRYSRNARLPFISASLYKLVLATDILNRIEQQSLAFEERVVLQEWYFPATENWDGAYGYDMIGAEITIDEALWATICVSSNIAALALLELTDGAVMNALARSVGLKSTTFGSVLSSLDNWPPDESTAETQEQLGETVRLIETSSWQWNVNLTSPADMTRFMHGVLQGTIVSTFVSSELLRLLLAQEINDRMPALLPDGTAIAHKTGNLTSIVHDAGAILTDDGPLLLTMLSQSVPDEYHTTRLLQSIAAMVYAELLAEHSSQQTPRMSEGEAQTYRLF